MKWGWNLDGDELIAVMERFEDILLKLCTAIVKLVTVAKDKGFDAVMYVDHAKLYSVTTRCQMNYRKMLGTDFYLYIAAIFLNLI